MPCHQKPSFGDSFSRFRCTGDANFDIPAAVALVFVADKNKPPGIKETQFHVVLSSTMSRVGPTYKATSVIKKDLGVTWLTARREGLRENIDGETILNQVYDQLGQRIHFSNLYIGVTKERKCCIGQEIVGRMTSLAFHNVCGKYQRYFFVNDAGIKTGDTFRFYHPDSTTLLSSAAAVSNHLRSFHQGSNNAHWR